MNVETIIFYCFAALTLLAGLKVITSRNPVHAVLFLVLAFVSTAGIWMLLEAEFLALTLILVYVGAVMVLFLFVVMMLDIDLTRLREGWYKWMGFGAVLATLIGVQMSMILSEPSVSAGKEALKHDADYSNTRELGMLIYTEYVYAFEIAAVLLLVAMVAAIALTLRDRKDSKHQQISKQVAVRRQDRVRLVTMPSEQKLADTSTSSDKEA